MRIIYLSFFLLSYFFTHAQVPAGYYSSAEGLSGEELKTALHNIIDNHIEFPYTDSSTDTWDILKETDEDPNNPDNVIGIYSAFSMNAEAEYNNGDGWNREHVWAQSRGELGTSRGPGTDVHHLRASDISTNSARSNRNFDEATEQYVDKSGTYSGTTNSYTSSSKYIWEPRAEVKGDVARMLFYMAVRYEGDTGEPDLELVEEYQDNTSKEPKHARLSILLQWHEEDPVDDYERRRNDIIYTYQKNRNPFIDHPEYVSYIWGNEQPVTSVNEPLIAHTYVVPNPFSSEVNITVPENAELRLLNIQGQILYNCSDTCITSFRKQLSEMEKGIYLLFVVTPGAAELQKLVKE